MVEFGVWKPPASAPSAPTSMPLLSKNALPRLFVTDGPANDCWMNTGWLGVTVSSSCNVGKRTGAGAGVNWLMSNPPIDVIHSPAGNVFAFSPSVASTSAIDCAFSSRVSCPGRSPSRTTWL